MSSISDLRLQAQCLRNLRATMVQRGDMPPYSGRPRGYLDALFLGTAIGRLLPPGVKSDGPIEDGVQTQTLIAWHENGAPTFRITRDALDSFLLTDVSSLTWGDLTFPFDPFLILPPEDNPLVFISEDGVHRNIQHIWVSVAYLPPQNTPMSISEGLEEAFRKPDHSKSIAELDEKLGYLPYLVVSANEDGSEGFGLSRHFVLGDGALSIRPWLNGDLPGRKSNWLNEKSKFTMELICRVVANLVMWLDGSDTATGKRNWSKPIVRKRPGLVKTQEFVVGRNIRISQSLRDAAKALRLSDSNVKARESWHLLEQLLVRGHWKSQAYGPRCSLHRRIQIEPYWKGEESAPIRTREFTLGEE